MGSGRECACRLGSDRGAVMVGARLIAALLVLAVFDQAYGARDRGRHSEAWLCSCNGTPYINDGQYYCSPYGWITQYPIPELDLCPYRVNRGPMDGGDGLCGNAKTGTSGWVLQTFHGMSFPDWGCRDHDFCYSNCREQKISCDFALLDGLTNGCNSTFPEWADSQGWWNGTFRAQCKVLANAYFQAVLYRGFSSYQDSQLQACQCGPSSGCAGGEVICLYYGQDGCPGGAHYPYLPGPWVGPLPPPWNPAPLPGIDPGGF